MTTTTTTDLFTDWRAGTCLLCQAESGHTPTCPSVVPDAVDLLVEDLPGGGKRTWTMSGLKYNATPDRRARFVAAGPAHYGELRWHHTIDGDSLPFSMGALINEIVPQMGIGRWLARYAFSPLGVVRVADCNCNDVTRDRCDFPGHPFGNAEPDFWPDYAPLVLRMRQPAGWWDWWMLDTGMNAVVVCQDDYTNDPAPCEATKACVMGWCHHCPGTMKPREGETARRPCQHDCGHPGATTAVGASS